MCHKLEMSDFLLYRKGYYEYQSMFQDYFKENAQLYWNVFTTYHQTQDSYLKIKNKYNLSSTYHVYYICNVVKEFIENPEKYLHLKWESFETDETNLKIKQLELHGHKKIVELTRNILQYKIQYSLGMELPIYEIIRFYPSFKNQDRRFNICNKLKKIIAVINGVHVLVFDDVYDDKATGKLCFTLTSKFQEYYLLIGYNNE